VGGLLGGLGVPIPIVSAIVSAMDSALNKAWDLYKHARDRGCKPNWDKILESSRTRTNPVEACFGRGLHGRHRGVRVANVLQPDTVRLHTSPA